ncbi:hypothetical protein [Pelagibius sp. 7325]|uniref:hypothetical protein n=1 Tax=Pelagibius sp. 7325 TaxID=3131994 RepID=UPI0030EEF7FC
MAKAVAVRGQPQGGGAQGSGAQGKGGPGKAASQGQRKAGKARRGPRTWVKVLALIILFPFAAVLLPTTLVFFTMMAPTWVAYMTDRSKEKHLAATVGMLNFAGTLPAIITLWARGQNHPVAMDLLGDVYVWVVAYGAASCGWLIFGFMPNIVGSYYRMTTQNRIRGLVKRQKALIAEWGHAVAEGIGVIPSGDDDDAEAGEGAEDEEEPEVTEAELVPPRRAR